jgi:rubrerythrin
METSVKTGLLGDEDDELNYYVLESPGLSRLSLNITCFIGLFIFGWLLVTVFDTLGKKRTGYFYIVPLFITLVISWNFYHWVAYIGILIYFTGWAHANMLLSNIRSSAMDRLDDIDQLSESQKTADIILEQGILEGKVLGEEGAVSTLGTAFQMNGGNPRLLFLAGVVLIARKKYSYARQFFNKAKLSTDDQGLIKVLNKNLASAQEKNIKMGGISKEWPEPTQETRPVDPVSPKPEQFPISSSQPNQIESEYIEKENVPMVKNKSEQNGLALKDQPGQKLSGLTKCPNCGMRVLPKPDGTCPSCQAKIF